MYQHYVAHYVSIINKMRLWTLICLFMIKARVIITFNTNLEIHKITKISKLFGNKYQTDFFGFSNDVHRRCGGCDSKMILQIILSRSSRWNIFSSQNMRYQRNQVYRTSFQEHRKTTPCSQSKTRFEIIHTFCKLKCIYKKTGTGKLGMVIILI